MANGKLWRMEPVRFVLKKLAATLCVCAGGGLV